MIDEKIDWSTFLVGAEGRKFGHVLVKKGDVFLSRGLHLSVRQANGDYGITADSLAGIATGGWDGSNVCMIRYADGRWADGFGPDGPVQVQPTTPEGWKALLPSDKLPEVNIPVDYPVGTVIAEHSFGQGTVLRITQKDGCYYTVEVLATSSSSCPIVGETTRFQDASYLASHSKVLFPAPAAVPSTVEKEAPPKDVPSNYVPSGTYDGPINPGAVFCRRDNAEETVQVDGFDRRTATVTVWDGPGSDIKTVNVKRFRRVYVPVRPTTQSGWKLLYPTGHHCRTEAELLDYPVGTVIGVRVGEHDWRPSVLEITKKDDKRFYFKVLCGRDLMVSSFVRGSNFHSYGVVLFEAPPHQPKKAEEPSVAPAVPTLKEDSVMGAAQKLYDAFMVYREMVLGTGHRIETQVDGRKGTTLTIENAKSANPRVTIDMVFPVAKDEG